VSAVYVSLTVDRQAAEARLPIAYVLPSIVSMQPQAVLMHGAAPNATMDLTLEVAGFTGRGADVSGVSVMTARAPCAALDALGTYCSCVDWTMITSNDAHTH